MRRRALLSAVTASTVGLAGCSFQWGPRRGGGSPDDTPTDRRTTTGADDTTTRSTVTTTDTPPSEPEIDPPAPDLDGTVVDLDAGPRTLAVRPHRLIHADRVRVRFRFAPVDGEHPPNLGVELRNGRNNEVTLEPHELPVLGSPVAELRGSGRGLLLFVPSEWNRIAEGEPPVERGPEGYWRLGDSDIDGDVYPDRIRMDPGETVRADSAVVGPPDSDGRPTGVYGVAETDVELTVWHSERPGPTAPSRFGDRAVPALGDSVPAVSWYHEAGPETPVYVDPRTEGAELPARLGFTVVNHTRDAVPCGQWGLFKLVDGTFYEVDTSAAADGCRELLPGGRGTHRLLAFADDPVANDLPGETVVGHLGGGTYGVVVFGAGAETDASGALVGLEGPAVDVRPIEGVTVERDGATVTVRDPERDEAVETATATLTRADDAERRLIAEQVMQRDRNRPLRNTLPFLEGDVDRVVLETTPSGAGISPGGATNRRRFLFREQAHELVAERSSEN